jgi:hypothetical protein
MIYADGFYLPDLLKDPIEYYKHYYFYTRDKEKLYKVV